MAITYVFGIAMGIELERQRTRADYVYLIGAKERSEQESKRESD